MRVICRKPVKEGAAHLAPAGILGRTAQPMKPGHHTAGRSLREPKRQLRRRFRDVTPVWLGIAVRTGNVCCCATLHNGIGDAALLRATPYRRFTGPALVKRRYGVAR